jgi:Na+/H+ antiporter NhaD/arsenite permease-like protein
MATVQDEEFKKVDEVFNRIVSRKLDGASSSRWTSVFVLLVIIVLIVTAVVYYLYKQRKGKKEVRAVPAPVAEIVPKV